MHRLAAMAVACHLLIALLLVEGSLARQTLPSTASLRLRVLQSTNARLHHQLLNNESLQRDQFSGVAFLHRERRTSKVASCKAIIGCDIGGVSASNRRDESSTPNSLESILSIRGGSSSSNSNAVQNMLKSILSSQSLPSPIKQVIEMICQFIENLTGWNVLPRVEEKRKKQSKSKKNNPQEVLVEEVINVGTKKRKKRRSKQKDVEEVKMAASVAPKKKRRSSEAAPETTTSDPEKKAKETTTPEKAATAPIKKNNPKPKRPDVASQKFLANKMKSSNPNYRIQRELKEFLSSPPPGLTVKISGKNVRLWVITLSMPDNTIYAGETYKLRVSFPGDYPTSPPSVFFMSPTPRHEHVYTNGDICLSLLGKDWRPIMTASSVAQAIMSILCGAQRKSLPMDNARHAGNKPGLKQDDWVYHDDNC